jgi:hypothetical protein
MLESSYTSQSSGNVASGSSGVSGSKTDYWPLSKLKKCFTNYQSNKRAEIDEQIDARRYYHGSQYTDKQVKALNARKQPIMTYNVVGRKVDGNVGTIEASRMAPKAYARTPQHEEGAELVTAALRYVLDKERWKGKSPHVGHSAAVDGIGGIELGLEPGKKEGDYDVTLTEVDVSKFFYDPHSKKFDFSDARYMGVSDRFTEDEAEELVPDEDFSGMLDNDAELAPSSDSEMRWASDDDEDRWIRIVEIWYRHRGKWCWALFTGSKVLKEGESPFKDEKGKTFCKYRMFSGNVDQDNDRYGLVRNIKSPQDGLNAKQSKAVHIAQSKRLIVRTGAVGDVEKARQEYARPDGLIEVNGANVNEGIKTDDQSFDFAGILQLQEFDKEFISNYGPNADLIGQGMGGQGAKSGRAISLMQEAGLRAIGPFILSNRAWKIDVYNSIWYAIRMYWTAERFIRVTDDENLSQFVQINQLQLDEAGNPVLVNAIGQMDVDIIIDEGADTITMMQDFYETLQQVLPAVAPMLAPPKANAMVDMLIEASPMASEQKKKYREAGQEPDPMAEQAKQAELAGIIADVENKQADTQLKGAQAAKAMVDAQVAPMAAMMDGQGQPMPMGEYEPPPELQDAREMAEIEEKRASATLKYAQAGKAQVETQLAPAQLQADQQNAAADRASNERQANADRAVNVRQSEADRKEQRRSGDADRKIAAKKATQKPSPARR